MIIILNLTGKHDHPPTTTSTVRSSTQITVPEVVDLSQEEDDTGEQSVSEASTVVALETSTPTSTVASTDTKIQSKAQEETTSPTTEVTPNITFVVLQSNLDFRVPKARMRLHFCLFSIKGCIYYSYGL